MVGGAGERSAEDEKGGSTDRAATSAGGVQVGMALHPWSAPGSPQFRSDTGPPQGRPDVAS